MACSLGRIQISLALLDEVKASDVATDAFIPRRRFASPCQAKNKTFLLCGWRVISTNCVRDKGLSCLLP